MDNNNKTLERYYIPARRPERIVDETAITQLIDSTSGGGSAGWTRALRFAAIGLIPIAAALLWWTAPWSTTPADALGPEMVRVVQITTYDDGTPSDTTIIMAPANTWDIPEPTGNMVALSPITPFELNDSELSKLGIERNTNGIFLFNNSLRDSLQVSVQYFGRVRHWPVAYRKPTSGSRWMYPEAQNDKSKVPAMDSINISGITIHDWSFRPLLVTDDRGAWRIHFANPSRFTPELLERHNSLPEDSPERLRVAQEIWVAGKQAIYDRVDRLIPILVRSKETAATPSDRWRPDIIAWYEATPEVLAALPDRVAVAFAGNVRMDNNGPDGQHGQNGREVTDQGNTRREGPNRLGPSQSAEVRRYDATETSEQQSPAATRNDANVDVDTVLPKTTRQNTTVGPGGSASQSGALRNFDLAPNPAQTSTTFRFRLVQARTATLSIHNLQGTAVRELPHIECDMTGQWEIEMPLNGLPDGIYFAAITTDQGERLVQRLLVVKR